MDKKKLRLSPRPTTCDQRQHVHNTLEAGEVVQHALHQLQEIDASQVPAAEEKK